MSILRRRTKRAAGTSGTTGRAELTRFLELNHHNDLQGQLRLLITEVFLHFPEPAETIIRHALNWDLNQDKAAELLRGDVEFGFSWGSIEGVLTDCGAAPVHIEVARDLFYGVPHHDLVPRQAPAPTAEASPTPLRPVSPDTPADADDSGGGDLDDGGDALEDVGPEPVVKPDPLTATTITEFVQMMADYRIWRGRRSYRRMAAASGYAASTMSGIPNRTSLPALELVTAYIESCGGDPHDVDTWTDAWRRVAMKYERPPDPRPRD